MTLYTHLHIYDANVIYFSALYPESLLPLSQAVRDQVTLESSDLEWKS